MYSAFDLENRRYLSTGRNAKTYEECLEAVKFSMALLHSEDLDDLPDKKLLKLLNIRIDKHKNRTYNFAGSLLDNIIASYYNSPDFV